MRNVLVVGSVQWRDRRSTTAALKRVVDTYRPPYTLLVDDSGDGTARYAAAVASDLGWTVRTYKVDPKCSAECPPGHRRPGGVLGDWCPTANRRAFVAQLDAGPDLVLVLMSPTGRETGQRFGQMAARERGIAVWEYHAQVAARKGKRDGVTTG